MNEMITKILIDTIKIIKDLSEKNLYSIEKEKQQSILIYYKIGRRQLQRNIINKEILEKRCIFANINYNQYLSEEEIQKEVKVVQVAQDKIKEKSSKLKKYNY